MREWYEENQIDKEHTDLEIRQIYVWLVSKNNMVAIVTKSNGDSQFPGGHPEEGESYIETAQREVKEETGLDISEFTSKLNQFGYYLVEENNQRYLQLRFILKLPEDESMYKLSVNEKSEEERPVESVRWVELFNLPNYIPWTKGLEEYLKVMNIVSEK
ncbi:MAG: NUDIX hydrolase [Candidatus Dojkabacteria bacterium]|nr:NUDIX hydrolase [Candidatus Dojkabacteria bacterium]